MILPDNRYSFNTKKKRKKTLLLFFFAAILLIAGGIVLFNNYNSEKQIRLINSEPTEDSLLDLWDKKKYDEIIQKCEEQLKKKPLDYQALSFTGFSYFYKGVAQFTIEEKYPMLDKAIIYLRKADMLQNEPFPGRIKYILGKTYFHKGKYFTDLSIKYIEDSIKEGFIAEDSYEYLGLAYINLDLYQKGIDYFLLAAENNPSDTLYLVLGQSYYKTNNLNKAEEYLIWTLNSTKDIILEQKSRMLLGKIYQETDKQLKAEEQYLKVLEINPKSADAYYYLGEIYESLRDRAKARFSWRKALEIDPYHYGARLKLY